MWGKRTHKKDVREEEERTSICGRDGQIRRRGANACGREVEREKLRGKNVWVEKL